MVNFGIDDISFTLSSTTIYDGKPKVQVYHPQTLYLFDTKGRQLLQKHLEGREQMIDISSFSKGIYFLNGEQISEKILIR